MGTMHETQTQTHEEQTVHALAWNSGAGALSPTQLAALREYQRCAQADGSTGYPHGFAADDPNYPSIFEFVARYDRYAPSGWTVRAAFSPPVVPAGSFRIGQYRVRTSDAPFPIYLCPIG